MQSHDKPKESPPYKTLAALVMGRTMQQAGEADGDTKLVEIGKELERKELERKALEAATAGLETLPDET